MNSFYANAAKAALFFVLLGGGSVASAAAFIQCPGDTNADAVPDVPVLDAQGNPRNIKCMHLSSGDGFVNMADGKLQYIFSFSDLTGIPEADSISAGILAANFPAPTIALDEGQEFYLSLTNVGMAHRPDLFDPHTVHFHGFPNASSIFDGVPDATVSINMGATLTYYYKLVEPGTYMYHCHVEATEHMQMGMLGNLYVRPAQNGRPIPDPDGSGRVHDKFVYNDGDGATGYDIEVPIQLGSFDSEFHDASMNVQPLPFQSMKARYAMLNGRGYPDTVQPSNYFETHPGAAQTENGGVNSQPVSSLVEATKGQKILLRLSNLNVTNYFTVTALGIPMKVVGGGARQLRGPTGKETAYETTSVTLGGGEAVEVILDTKDVPVGTYFLYTTNMNYLSNGNQDFGGMMTEIRIN